MAPQVWFRIVGWNIKSPLLRGAWPGWTVRRARNAKRLATLRPDVFCGVEMGKLAHVKWLRDSMRKRGWSMAIADGGANWRYILYNAKKFRQLRGAQRVLKGTYRGDTKEVTWAQLQERAAPHRLILAFSAHLEVDGPDAVRFTEAHSLVDTVEDIKNTLGMSWDDCYVYADVNDRGGVQAILEKSRLHNLVIATPFDTMNRWSKVRRRIKRNQSMDVLMAGDQVRAKKTFSPDAHDGSDHNPVGADILA